MDATEAVKPYSGRRAVVACDDLFFVARILSALRKLGFEAESAASADEALAKAASDPDLVIISLASRRLGGFETVRRLKQQGVPRIVGFVSHTLIPEVREDARAAGVGMVCANSAVTQRLPEIVERALSGGANAGVDLPE